MNIRICEEGKQRMEIYFCPLFSGSSGNSLFCQYGETRLLIDAGKPGRSVTEALLSIGVEPESLSGLLITHEHSDHISGAGVLARKYQLPIYATRGTWLGMEDKIGKVSANLRREFRAGQDFYIGDIGVESFSIPHDAADPVGFRLWGGELSAGVATDLGYFPQEVYSHLAGSSLVLLESNHDPDMLRANPHYNAALKSRILGERGHLSNETSSRALLALIASGTSNIVLGHLSGENNTPELALRVAEDAMREAGMTPGKEAQVEVTLRDRRGKLYRIAGE